MNFNILRTKKIKTNLHLTKLANHNLRIKHQHNVDKTKSILNKILVNKLEIDVRSSKDLQIKLNKFYEDEGIKIKNDNVLMLEFVVSASPNFFENKTKNEIDAWANHQILFFKNEFGENLKLAVLHLDEKTPHLHINISTEIKSIKKYKNQKGEFFKETKSLNAKRFDPEFLVSLHDRHAIHNQKFGLQRGQRNSKREHKSLKEFYKYVDSALNNDYTKQIASLIDSVEKNILGNVSVEKLKEKFTPEFNKLLKQNKYLKEKYNFDTRSFENKLKNLEEKLIKKEKFLLEKEEQLKGRRDVFVESIRSNLEETQLINTLEVENLELKNQLEHYKFRDEESKKVIQELKLKSKI